MRLALEAFGLELALTFGPVDEMDDDELDATPGHVQHVEGSFEPAPSTDDGYVDPDERARSFGFA